MKKTVVFLLLILIAAGIGLGFYFFDKKVPGLGNVKPDFELTANALYDSFELDEATSLIKFEGKVLQVSGEVSKVKLSDSTLSVILMADNAIVGGVNCSLRDIDAKISKGDKVTIKGRCQGYLMNVVMTNCIKVEDQ